MSDEDKRCFTYCGDGVCDCEIGQERELDPPMSDHTGADGEGQGAPLDGLPWRDMQTAPTGVPIIARHRPNPRMPHGWVATILLGHGDEEEVGSLDTILHYNGNDLVRRFHGCWTGWLPIAPCDEPPSGRDRNGLGGDSPAGAVDEASSEVEAPDPSEIPTLKAEIERLEAEKNRLRSECDMLATQASACAEEVDRVRVEIGTVQAENERLTQVCTGLGSDLRIAESERDAAHKGAEIWALRCGVVIGRSPIPDAPADAGRLAAEAYWRASRIDHIVRWEDRTVEERQRWASAEGACIEKARGQAPEVQSLVAEIERLQIIIRDREWKRDLAEQESAQLSSALAESERKRAEAEAEITATRARLPDSLRSGKLEFGVANLAMGWRGANDGRWRYGYAMRMLLQFVDRAAGEGLAFLETEDGPAIDAADLCADVASLLRVEFDSDTFRALAKPPSEAELSALITQEVEHGR